MDVMSKKLGTKGLKRLIAKHTLEKVDCPFKKNQLVVVDKFDLPTGIANPYPYYEGECLLFLGEIVQMPSHCIVVNRAGKVLWGYHTDNFREPTEDEI